jgi:hypothetical protein
MIVQPGLHRIGLVDTEDVRRASNAAARAAAAVESQLGGAVGFAVGGTLRARRAKNRRTGTKEMATSDFAVALDIFAQIASSLGVPRYTAGTPKDVAFLVE